MPPRKHTPGSPKAVSVLRVGDMPQPELRLAVELYYTMQENRKAANLQRGSLGDREVGGALVTGFDIEGILAQWATNNENLEKAIKKIIERLLRTSKIARWANNQMGVGPVISAVLLAHFDITKAPKPGHFNSFAGYGDPNRKWEKGMKRPYCHRVKQACFHIGEEFMKNNKKVECYYGRLYKIKKDKLTAKNETGGFAEKAANYTTVTPRVKKLLLQGTLPLANVDAMARRYAVKIFISHLWALMYWEHYGAAPAFVYPIVALAYLGHRHHVKIPDMWMFPGFEEAYYGTPADPNQGGDEQAMIEQQVQELEGYELTFKESEDDEEGEEGEGE